LGFVEDEALYGVAVVGVLFGELDAGRNVGLGYPVLLDHLEKHESNDEITVIDRFTLESYPPKHFVTSHDEAVRTLTSSVPRFFPGDYVYERS
jgi:hypothetical protein